MRRDALGRSRDVRERGVVIFRDGKVQEVSPDELDETDDLSEGDN